MKCTEFEIVVNELLDLRLDLKADMRISAHVETCESCKEDLMIYDSLATINEPRKTQETLAPVGRSGNRVEIASAVRTQQAVRQKRLGYVVLTAVVALFLVLGPLSDYFFVQNSRPNNVAKAFQDQGSAFADLTDRAGSKSNAMGQDDDQTTNGENANESETSIADSNSSSGTHSEAGNSVVESFGPENSNSADRNFPAGSSSRMDGNSFWANNALPPMQDPFGKFDGAYQRIPETPDLDDLERVGESLGTVWKTIQEDDYILPLVKQGALLLVRGS